MTRLSDADLVVRARTGDAAAFTELYNRHERAAHRLAATYPRAGSADDLVHGAFERVLGAITRGGGPDESFRAYLFVTLRRLAAAQIAATSAEPVDDVPEGLQDEAPEAIDPAERAIVLRAYGSLPDRMQAVLWQTEVEGRPPRELAPVLGMSPNATAALAWRAREKLRQAYLQAHLQASPRPGCEPHRSRLGAYVRDDVGNRARTATSAHVDGCASCQALVAELADVNSLFARSLLPWFAAPAHIGAIAAAGTTGTAGLSVAGGAAGARLLGQQVVSKIRANPAVSGAVVVASAAVAAALAVSMIGGESTVDEPGAPAPAAASAVPTDPADAAPPDPPPATVPPPAPRPHAAQPALAPDRPAPTAAPPPPDTRATEPAVVPTPPAAPESSPPPEAPPQPGPQPAPPLGPVVWLAGDSQVRITLTNDSAERTGFLVVSLEAEGGAVVGRRPAGCALGIAVRTAGLCGLPPLRPGETAVVHVPVQVTGPGQTARATVCAATAPRLDCDTVFLAPTTVALD